MTEDAIRDKILSIKDLYTLPQTLVEVLRLTENPQTSSYDLSRIILRDAPITTRLLKLANSAMYGRTGTVNTVHQAVVLLGFRSVKSLVLSTSVYDIFSDEEASKALDLGQFWLHSLETAGIAQFLASRIGYQPQEEAFVAGLLHDIGLLLMARVFGDDYKEFVCKTQETEDWCAAERDHFGVAHTEAATILLSEWGLPKQLVDAAGQHHDVMGCDDPEVERLTLIVALADHLGHQGIEAKRALSRDHIEAKRHAVSKLGLEPIDLVSVDAWISENLAALASHLDIAIGSPVDILTRANQRLYELYVDMESLLLASSASPAPPNKEYASQILEAITATFSHYINNATTTIMGHSELVEMGIRKGIYADPEGRITDSMRMIERAVINISAVLTEMKRVTEFEVVDYHDRAKILNIEEKVKQRLEIMLEE